MSGSQNYNAPNFIIPYSMPPGVPDQLAPIIRPIYTAFQSIIQTLIFYGGIAPRNPGNVLSSNNDPSAILSGNVHRFYTQATETITFGAAINLYNSLGTLSVRNANATDSTKPCDGFCSQPGGILNSGIGEVCLSDGVIIGLSGLVVGSRYYLSTAAGGYTTTAPVAAGNLQQSLGIAITTTSLRFWTGLQIQH